MTQIDLSNLTAREYLTYLQDQTDSFTKNWTPNININEFVKDFPAIERSDSLIKRLSLTIKGLRNRETTVGGVNEQSFQSIAKKILDSVPKKTSKRLRNTVMGVLPTFDANAQAIRTPKGESIVALNLGLMNFLSLLNSVTSRFLAIKEDPQRDVSFNDFARMAVPVCEHFLMKTPPPNYHPALHPARLRFFIALTACQEAFTICHEFGHILLGHLSENNVMEDQLTPELKVDYIIKNHDEEYEADKIRKMLKSHFNIFREA